VKCNHGATYNRNNAVLHIPLIVHICIYYQIYCLMSQRLGNLCRLGLLLVFHVQSLTRVIFLLIHIVTIC